jgi:GT2 family glycosyltransferase
MKDPKVVAVIPNWNGKADILECLHNLTRQNYLNLEIVVVDNNSQDGSVEAIRSQFPNITLICNEINQGFISVNRGINYALEQGAEYIGILNNDVIFHPEMFRELINAAESDEQIAVAGPKIYYYDEPEQIWAAGGIIDFSEVVVRMRGHNQKDQGQYDLPADVDYIPFCGVVAKARAVREVGLLDPTYFAYFDDPDWCLRMHQHGYRIRYVPTAQMWHKVSRTAGSYSPQGCYALGINAVVFMKKYAKWYQWVKWFVYAVLTLPFLYLVRTFQGKGKSALAKAQGIWDGFHGVRVTPETFLRNW